jgi:hypothetical protein
MGSAIRPFYCRMAISIFQRRDTEGSEGSEDTERARVYRKLEASPQNG